MGSPNPLIIFLAKPATQAVNNVAAVPINAVNTGGFQPGITSPAEFSTGILQTTAAVATMIFPALRIAAVATGVYFADLLNAAAAKGISIEMGTAGKGTAFGLDQNNPQAIVVDPDCFCVNPISVGVKQC